MVVVAGWQEQVHSCCLDQTSAGALHTHMVVAVVANTSNGKRRHTHLSTGACECPALQPLNKYNMTLLASICLHPGRQHIQGGYRQMSSAAISSSIHYRCPKFARAKLCRQRNTYLSPLPPGAMAPAQKTHHPLPHCWHCGLLFGGHFALCLIQKGPWLWSFLSSAAVSQALTAG